jgi:hypothetical protein
MNICHYCPCDLNHKTYRPIGGGQLVAIRMLNIGLLGIISSAATAFVIYNAYTIKQQQFYPTCIYLMKSNVSMLVVNILSCNDE